MRKYERRILHERYFPDRNPRSTGLLVDGSIALLTPVSKSAHEWIEDNISKEGFQPCWPTVVIEHRYVADILEGIRIDGMVIA